MPKGGIAAPPLPTWCAPAERDDAEGLERDRQKLAENSLVQGLLNSFPQPVMILNRFRQVVAFNRALEALVAGTAGDIIGKRPGEVFHCIHWREEPGGCGTTMFCRTCGALGAIAGSQRFGMSETRECRMIVNDGHGESALDLEVAASPLDLDSTYTVFTVRDIADEKRRAALERIFYHDVLNAAGSLRGLLEIWPDFSGSEAREICYTAVDVTDQILEEIRSARELAAAERGELEPHWKNVDAGRMLIKLCCLYSRHPVGIGKNLAPPVFSGESVICTDETLLRRVIGNLIKNALEASKPGQTVAVSFTNKGKPTFTVHNEDSMSAEVQHQLFQRSFTTKAEQGRGLGLHSVKLMTQRYLRGQVSFRSAPGEGTTFEVTLPARPPETPGRAAP